MILFEKKFWEEISVIAAVFIVECMFAMLMLFIYLAAYSLSEYEPLNSFVATVVFKIIVILPPLIYNIRKIVPKYKIKNYKAVTVWSVMTIVYILGIATLGGGGR